MDQANILIIGGGVIGCAIANAVSKRWQDVFLVEQFPKLGMATSTRNSGVNHSGIYYPKNSLKARLCVEANRLMFVTEPRNYPRGRQYDNLEAAGVEFKHGLLRADDGGRSVQVAIRT